MRNDYPPTRSMHNLVQLRDMLAHLQHAFERVANDRTTDWIAPVYEVAMARDLTPLCGHCEIVSVTLYWLLGGELLHGTITYASGIASGHMWNRLPIIGVVDLTSHQFEGGNGFDPPYHVLAAIEAVSPYAMPVMPNPPSRWIRWVDALEANPTFQAVRKRYPLLPSIPRTWLDVQGQPRPQQIIVYGAPLYEDNHIPVGRKVGEPIDTPMGLDDDYPDDGTPGGLEDAIFYYDDDVPF